MSRGARRAAVNAAHPARWSTVPTHAARVAGPARAGHDPSGATVPFVPGGAAGRVVVVPPDEVPVGAAVLAVVVLLADQRAGSTPGSDPGRRPLTLARRDAATNASSPPDDTAPAGVYLARAGLTIDRSGRTVRVGDDVVELTRREFDLLDHVCTRPGQVHTRDQLLAAVWGPGRPADAGPRTVDVHVARVRRKLGRPHAGALETVRGVGYRWVP